MTVKKHISLQQLIGSKEEFYISVYITRAAQEGRGEEEYGKKSEK